MDINPAEKIILALDGMDREQAIKLASNLPGLVWVKVGLELFVSEGPQVLVDLQERGFKVFLDLKFHDIPTTMASACRKATLMGVDLITVHACAGVKALKESRYAVFEAASQSGLTPPKLIAVTILTSWDRQSLSSDLGVTESIQTRVESFASLTHQAGIEGCVCSPWEAAALRKNYPLPFELVTPGVRPLGSDSADQARFMSPSKALLQGASRLVIGRPITKAKDPAKAFHECCEDILMNF